MLGGPFGAAIDNRIKYDEEDHVRRCMARKKPRVPRYEKETNRAKQEAERLKGEQARAEKARSRIQADLSRQAPNNSFAGGRLYYEDLEFTCQGCGRQEIWTARQQQWWYEVAKGHVFSTAVHCRACRRRRRGGRVAESD